MCNVLCRRILCSINTTDDDSLLVRGKVEGEEKRDKCRSGSCQ
jgi:hypothetical protein